jgi:hypothetical protein
MARIIGLTILIISLTYLPYTEDAINLFLFIFGLGVALVSFINLKFWRVCVLAYCSIYLLIVLPPLFEITSDRGFIHFVNIAMTKLFEDGFIFVKFLYFWHLAILPIIVGFITLVIIWQIINVRFIKTT